ncbi:MAG: opacity family porin [[Pasteurella] mairii]|uniref:Porin, opacity type n=1 Tax=[Pasteurella] mairii TaxID=757 RepID=A0A379B2W0_9PAST|nr:opacity family porin [[Pasteurella] mairii]SUB32772.1 porin, opacity type [[Pasteurella] mairii]
MKKTVLAILMGALAFASTTVSANWYVQGDLGISKIKSSGADNGEISEKKFSPSVSVGYRFVDWRLALDYTHYGKSDYGFGADNGFGNGNLKVNSFGLSAIYDINLNTSIKPYVGARIALNDVKWNESLVENINGQTRRSSDSDNTSKFGFGGFVGATYEFYPNWSLNGAVEYNRLAKINDVNINQYGAKVGLRYEF